MSDGRPAGRAGAGLYDNGVTRPGYCWEYGDGTGEAVRDRPFVIEAPVRIRCYRHEGIVVANHQRFEGLGGLAATWELAPADGRIRTAPAELPDLRPGETAAVPFPFALPADGGAAWLTLRVVTAEDQPCAPRSTEVCAPRIRLRRAAPARPVRAVQADDEGLLVHPPPTTAPMLTPAPSSPVPSPSRSSRVYVA